MVEVCRYRCWMILATTSQDLQRLPDCVDAWILEASIAPWPAEWDAGKTCKRESAATYSDIDRRGGAAFFQCSHTEVGVFRGVLARRTGYNMIIICISNSHLSKTVAELHFPIIYMISTIYTWLLSFHHKQIQQQSYHVILHLEISCFIWPHFLLRRVPQLILPGLPGLGSP